MSPAHRFTELQHVQGQERQRVSVPRSPRTVEQKPAIPAPCARPWFGASTLADFHARLLFGFRAISRLCAFCQGPDGIRNCFFSPSLQQTAEVRTCFQNN
ncbi:hypothetical protein M3J09_000817 [Ascochyta lentis]